MDWTTGMVEYWNGGPDSFSFLFLIFIFPVVFTPTYLSFLFFYTYIIESHKAFGSYRVGLKGIVIYYPDILI